MFDVTKHPELKTVAITVRNIFLSPEEVAVAADIGHLPEEEFCSKVVHLLGVEALEALSIYDLFSNAVLALIRDELSITNPELNPAFQYHFMFPVNSYRSLAKSLIVEDCVDLSFIESFDVGGVTENFRRLLKHSALTSAPSKPIETLGEHISESDELISIYRTLSSYPGGSESGDMPIDRGILNALTVLNHLGYKTKHSCEGHECYDNVGIPGSITPNILVQLNDDQISTLRALLTAHRVETGSEIHLSPHIALGDGVYLLEAGNRIILSALVGFERANYLQYTRGVLNSFVGRLASR